eukprot:TRINITY_DN36711_c0_g1_i1.p1 TRINITY_DN36711_c0_g1~~TRINITY_DN36711_c0_g1_i1.p1  ORF type:complete len:337 (+),score=68.33 TRINITY_DN36711_c0_g1_i1:16-1026(+)
MPPGTETAGRDGGTFLTQDADVKYRYSQKSSDHSLRNEGFEMEAQPRTLQSTLLIQKKKEMAEVQAELERKREEFFLRMARCQEKEDDLLVKQGAIQEQVLRFEKFLNDNDAKRVRASRKAAEEIKLREEKEDQLTLLRTELQRLEVLHMKKKLLLERLSRFEQYLESVITESSDFPEIMAILNRHRTLTAANTDLLTGSRQDFKASEKLRAESQAWVKEAQNMTLLANSKVAELQQELDRRKAEYATTDSALQDQEGLLKGRWREAGEVNMAVDNLYSRCVEGRAEAQEPLSLHEKLLVIQQRLQDVGDIVSKFHKEHRDLRGVRFDENKKHPRG